MMLALLGGKSIRKADSWFPWPKPGMKVESLLKDVLFSKRWTIRSRWTGTQTKEREFAELFSDFLGVNYCTTHPSGTAALSMALEAMGIGAGDEVIIPGLTWVATAVAVVNVNAIPVFVDVDPSTFCISPEAAEAAITSRTKCILPVHLHAIMADMSRIMEISARHDVLVLEDCAQAHGATWDNKAAGSFGTAGAFSMHNDKLLTCGEGGAVITNDKEIYQKLQALRLDGFDYLGKPYPTVEGYYEFPEVGEIMGTSNCISEFQAAVLIDQLDQLPEQNIVRERNGNYLNKLLSDVEGLSPLRCPKQQTLQTFYDYPVLYNSDAFAGCNIYSICRALSAELELPVFPDSPPLYSEELYKPLSKRRHHISQEYVNALSPDKYNLQVAERAQHELILFPHWTLLSDMRAVEDVASAFEKVQREANALRKVEDDVDKLVGYQIN